MKKTSDQSSQCEEMRRHLDAYLDDEMPEASLRRRVEQHLEGCLGCRAELEVLEALHDRLQDLPALTASKRLRGSVQALAHDSASSSPKGWAPKSLVGMAVAAAVLVAFSTSAYWLWLAQDLRHESLSGDGRDLAAFVDDYVAYVQSDSAPVMETPDPDRMEGWLAARLDFAPKLPRWPWAELISGRLCFIHDRRVARVEYRAGENDLTLFVQPLAETDGDETAALMSSPKTQRLRGFEVACWRSSELDYVLVGPASVADLFANLETDG